jgi:hypothetical protein
MKKPVFGQVRNITIEAYAIFNLESVRAAKTAARIQIQKHSPSRSASEELISQLRQMFPCLPLSLLFSFSPCTVCTSVVGGQAMDLSSGDCSGLRTPSIPLSSSASSAGCSRGSQRSVQTSEDHSSLRRRRIDNQPEACGL